MFRGFWNLTWVEIKIFLREPLGVIGSVVIPIAIFLIFGRAIGGRTAGSERAAEYLGRDFPIFIALFIAISAALSLVAVISIYREGGILKRLRATPLRPTTILGAHVVVKLLFTSITLGLMLLAGRRFYPVSLDLNLWSFLGALLVSTVAVISLGFIIASVVPTARFAQPLGSLILYPMIAVSGLFVPLDRMGTVWEVIGRILPLSHVVDLMRIAWAGGSWLEVLPSLGALTLTVAVCLAVSSKVFRWE